MSSRWLPLLVSLLSAPVLAGVKENIQEIQTRLDKTASLYQQHKAEEARATIQNAYFEIFENLEGPIRINYSARKSFQMESTFWEIRQMMAENKPQADVQQAINGLKAELTDVLPALEKGHQLNAEGQHGTYTNQQILPYWKAQFKTIDDLLAQALEYYQAGDFAQAKKTFQQAQYDGYKNSEMETAVRQNRSAAVSAAINQQFYDLIKLSEQKDQLTALGYQTTTLLQDIEEQLPDLPATRETQQTQTTQTAPAKALVKDWQKVTASINQGVDEALRLYRQGENPKAMFALKMAYFEQFDEQGMAGLLNAKNPTLKTVIDQSFNRLFGMIKTDGQQTALEKEAVKLRENLAKAQRLIQ